MAYNNGFPVNYPQYYPPYYQQQQMQNTQQTQIQDGGFMVVPNESIVNSYPVAPGKCITFKIEGQPIVIEKSMGFSQLEAPKIDKYRLIKEEAPAKPQKECNCSSDVENLRNEIDKLWDKIRRLENESISNVSADQTEPNADVVTEV